MGGDNAIDTGGIDAFTVWPSWRGDGVVCFRGGEFSAKNISISSKVAKCATKDARQHQNSGCVGVCGRRLGSSYGGCWTLRLHTGKGPYSRRCCTAVPRCFQRTDFR